MHRCYATTVGPIAFHFDCISVFEVQKHARRVSQKKETIRLPAAPSWLGEPELTSSTRCAVLANIMHYIVIKMKYARKLHTLKRSGSAHLAVVVVAVVVDDVAPVNTVCACVCVCMSMNLSPRVRQSGRGVDFFNCILYMAKCYIICTPHLVLNTEPPHTHYTLHLSPNQPGWPGRRSSGTENNAITLH